MIELHEMKRTESKGKGMFEQDFYLYEMRNGEMDKKIEQTKMNMRQKQALEISNTEEESIIRNKIHSKINILASDHNTVSSQ